MIALHYGKNQVMEFSWEFLKMAHLDSLFLLGMKSEKKILIFNFIFFNYCEVVNTSPSHFEGHAGLFRLLMKVLLMLMYCDLYFTVSGNLRIGANGLVLIFSKNE